jgi:hypothetical protein
VQFKPLQIRKLRKNASDSVAKQRSKSGVFEAAAGIAVVDSMLQDPLTSSVFAVCVAVCLIGLSFWISGLVLDGVAICSDYLQRRSIARWMARRSTRWAEGGRR